MLTLEKRFENTVSEFDNHKQVYRWMIEKARKEAKIYKKTIKAFKFTMSNGFSINCKVDKNGELIILVAGQFDDKEVAKYAEKITEIIKELA